MLKRPCDDYVMLLRLIKLAMLLLLLLNYFSHVIYLPLYRISVLTNYFFEGCQAEST